MSFFKQLMNQILPKETEIKPSPVAETLLKEPIKHSDKFYANFAQWKDEKRQIGILFQLQKAAERIAADPSAKVNYFTYRDVQSKGFYFHGENLWTVEDYTFFVQHIIELLKSEGYRQTHSRREHIEEGEDLKTIERFQLKPKVKYRKNLPYNQLYGNILLEHRIINEKTNYIKLMTQLYQSRGFQEPLDFEIFMHKLFVS